MNEMEKYLTALEAAVETKNKKAIDLLEAFSAYVYHEIDCRAKEASGEERIVWEGMLQRVLLTITGMAKAAPSVWL
jgi:hypothetical protein